MNEQVILAVDDQGKFLEYIPKSVGHSGVGRRHLAITVLLCNQDNQVLLQKRKHRVFDKTWDFTASTHPLHKPHPCHSEESRFYRDDVGIYTSQDCHALRARNDKKCRICNKDNVDETLEEATLRSLKDEYDIDLSSKDVRVIGEFNYFAPYQTVQGEYCENEHDFLLIGGYNGPVKLNPEVGYEYKWIKKGELLKDMEQNPQKYSPWANEGLKVLKNSGFFN